MNYFKRGDLFIIKSNDKNLPISKEFDSPLIFWEFLSEKNVQQLRYVKVITSRSMLLVLGIAKSDTITILAKADEIKDAF